MAARFFPEPLHQIWAIDREKEQAYGVAVPRR
jgi:hypothetical protein